MEGFIWWHDTLICAAGLLICVGVICVERWYNNRKPKPRGATRIC